MTGAQILIKALKEEHVDVIFGYPGAANAPIYEQMRIDGLKHVLTRHEQAAANAASGFSRASGKTGVCMATSGPGATNLITGIATAYMDSIPLVAITGQVSSEMIGRDVFQEVDITGATLPFCKHSYLVKDIKDLYRVVKEAFYIASTGRKGPVLIDIPVDIQKQEIDSIEKINKVSIRGYKPDYPDNKEGLNQAANLIKKSKRPVICAGGGIISANAQDALMAFSKKNTIPVVTTLMGIGSITSDFEFGLGLLGSHGTSAANLAIRKADLIIVIGARAGDRATGDTDKFSEGKKIIHVDIDPAEIGKNLGTEVHIIGDCNDVLLKLTGMVNFDKREEYITEIISNKKKCNFNLKEGFVNPKLVIDTLSDLKDDLIVVTEVGQNQIWTANALKIKKDTKFFTSGGLGTMGYGLGAAIGAKEACKDKPVVLVAGDGSFQMNLQEIATLVQWNINVKIILFNNGFLGMVKELQDKSYKNNFGVSLNGSPNFQIIAKAYNIGSDIISNNEEVKSALEKMLDAKGPYLAEFKVDKNESTL